jgi:hypothetical protein
LLVTPTAAKVDESATQRSPRFHFFDKDATIQAAEIASLIESGENVVLTGPTINGDLELTPKPGQSITIPGILRVSDCTIKGNWKFNSCDFKQSVYISKCTIEQSLQFSRSTIQEDVAILDNTFKHAFKMGNCEIFGKLLLDSNTFCDSFSIGGPGTNCIVHDELQITKSIFERMFTLAYTTVRGEAHLASNDHRGMVNNTHMDFESNVFYELIEFSDFAKFWFTSFHKRVRFRYCQFKNVADFSACEFGGPVSFEGTSFEQLLSLDDVVLSAPLALQQRQFLPHDKPGGKPISNLSPSGRLNLRNAAFTELHVELPEDSDEVIRFLSVPDASEQGSSSPDENTLHALISNQTSLGRPSDAVYLALKRTQRSKRAIVTLQPSEVDVG